MVDAASRLFELPKGLRGLLGVRNDEEADCRVIAEAEEGGGDAAGKGDLGATGE